MVCALVEGCHRQGKTPTSRKGKQENKLKSAKKIDKY
jgi:hypothetical protein